MKYDVLMFVALLTVLVVTGVQALLPPQSDGEVLRNPPQQIILEPQPVSERVSLLERDFKYLSGAVEELREELRRQTSEIKQILREQNDETEKWIVIVLGLLITGDRGWAILQRVKNNRKEK